MMMTPITIEVPSDLLAQLELYADWLNYTVEKLIVSSLDYGFRSELRETPRSLEDAEQVRTALENRFLLTLLGESPDWQSLGQLHRRLCQVDKFIATHKEQK